MELTQNQCQLILNMTQDAVDVLTHKGGADIEWLCELTELYKVVKAEAIRLEAPKPRKAGKPKNTVVDNDTKQQISFSRKMQEECTLCSDYKHGCEGALKQICKYNEELKG